MSGISSRQPFASDVVPQSNHKEKYNINQLPLYIMKKSAYHKDTTHASADF